MAEAEVKRRLALEAADAAAFPAVVTSSPPTVRWLLCGRGRPIDQAAPESPYTVVLRPDAAYVAVPDIEAPRVAAEERFEELGFDVVPFAWHEGPGTTVTELLDGRPALRDDEPLAAARRRLLPEELERYRSAAAAAAAALADTLPRLAPEAREVDAAAELACRAHARGLFPVVVLVAGEERQGVHRHPLPTEAPLGRHALLALTAERDGLYVSLTRLVAFGPPPERLAELVRAAAAVDATMIAASRPGTTLGDVLDTAAAAYAGAGFPEEWRYHHQGGLTGYRGREVFAVPGEPARLPDACAVAWNPSITGGAKSEDTVLVVDGGFEVATRTPSLPELEVDGLRRPDIVVL